MEIRGIFAKSTELETIILEGNSHFTAGTAIYILTAQPKLTLFDFSKCIHADRGVVQKHLDAAGRKVKLVEHEFMPSQARMMQLMMQMQGQIPPDDHTKLLPDRVIIND